MGSVSVRVRTEDVYSHPDLEFWTCIHCKRRLHRQFWTFWTYFVDVKTSVWALAETLAMGASPQLLKEILL